MENLHPARLSPSLGQRRLNRREALKAAGIAAAGLLGGANPFLLTSPKARANPQQTAAGRRGGRLVFATRTDAPSLEPHTDVSDYRMRTSMLFYDSLVEWGEDFTIVPGLAERWETDGTRWVFYLRKGAEFSNGKDVTAADVVYSINRIMKLNPTGFGQQVESVRALDTHTVEIVLAEVSAPFLAALGGRFGYIVPENAEEMVNLKTEAIGSGPFIVKEYVQGQRLILARNPNSWHAGRTYLDEIAIHIIPDEANIVAGLRTGDIDAATLDDPRTFMVAQTIPHLVAKRTPAARWDILNFPLKTPPYDNLKVRQAIALSLDRDAIIQGAISGMGSHIGGYPQALWGALKPEETPFFHRDVEKAKQLLAESGVELPLRLTLRSIVGYGSLNAAAQVIVENLREAGILCNIHIVELGIWLEDYRNKTLRDMTLNAWGGHVDPDVVFYTQMRQAPRGRDVWSWDNSWVSAMLDKGRATLDQAERAEIYREIQREVASQVAWIPLYSPDILCVHQANVHGFNPHPSTYYFHMRYVSKS